MASWYVVYRDRHGRVESRVPMSSREAAESYARSARPDDGGGTATVEKG